MTRLPSDKQLAYARVLAEKQSESLPPDVEVDASACSAYIALMKDRPVPPSSAQLKYANEIYAALTDQVSPQAWERAAASTVECRKFIQEHKEAHDAFKQAREEQRWLAKTLDLFNKLDFIPASLMRELAGLPSPKEKFDAIEAWRKGGAGFSGLDPARLAGTQQQLIGYWLEGLQSTAFEGMGELDNLLGDNEKAAFDLDKLMSMLDSAACTGLDPDESPPPVRHVVLKLVGGGGGDKKPMVLSVLALSPVPDAAHPRGYRWAGAADAAPRFNRNQIGESAKWPGLLLEDMDAFDAWALGFTAARKEQAPDPAPTLADAFAVWDTAFDKLMPDVKGGVRRWVERYMRCRHQHGQTKSRKPVFALIDGGAASGATRNVCAAYRQILEEGDRLDRLPLFRAVADLVEAPKAAYRPEAEAEDLDHLVRYFGHMDSLKGGKRVAFPLDPAQRDALLALATTGPGQLLAVNGPPGTGKTSLMRGVIASHWIAPLLGAQDMPDCPVTLACAATNQAVTNIISSFDETPGPSLFDGAALAGAVHVGADSRWLPHLASYGWYMPANAEKDTDYQKYQLIGRRGPQVPWRFFGISKDLNELQATDAQALYLACAGRYFGEALALPAVLKRLRRKVQSTAAKVVELRNAAGRWLHALEAVAAAGRWSHAEEARRRFLLAEIAILGGKRGRGGALRKEAAQFDRLAEALDALQGWHGETAALADTLLGAHGDWRPPAVAAYVSLARQDSALALLAGEVDDLRQVTLFRRLQRKVAALIGLDDTRTRWDALREAMRACGLPVDGQGVPDFAVWAAALAARRARIREDIEQAAAGVVRARLRTLWEAGPVTGDWRADLEQCVAQAGRRRALLGAEQARLEEQQRLHTGELDRLSAAYERHAGAHAAARQANLGLLAALEGLCKHAAPAPAVAQLLDEVLARDEPLEEGALLEHRRALLRQLQDWLDLQVRPQQFHLAARYWEGRYLDSRLRLQERLADDAAATLSSEEQLRELAMLAPVFVVTAFSAPKLMRRHLHGIDEGKSPYLFGQAELLIVDEAGQGTPEVGACVFLFARRAIVVGDVAQLEPVWSMDESGDRLLVERFGVGDAGGDRYAGARPSGVLMAHGSVMRMAQRATFRSDPGFAVAGLTLTNHYRCLAPIIGICNRMVYGGDLRVATPQPGQLWRPELARLGYLVCDTVRNTKNPGGSRRNDSEAMCIARWIRENEAALCRHYDPSGQKDLADLVAVVTPFKGQKQALKKALATLYRAEWPDPGDRNALYNRMTIDTVHALQGAEKPVVIFSMVETAAPAQHQFYDKGTNLINVAVSRARELFVVAMSQEAVDHARALDARKLAKPSDHLWHAVVNEGSRLNMRHVVVVESPAKRTAIHQALGGSIEWEVVGSEGHVAELMNESGWDVAKAQAPAWGEVSAAGAALMARLQRLWPGMATLYLATDPDSEGEAIAWHLLRLLKEERRGGRQPAADAAPPAIRRMRLYNLRPDEIRRARDEAGAGLDEGLVKSALARGFLDRIVRLHYAHRLGLAPANQPQRGVGRVQLGILDLAAQAGRRAPAWRTRVRIPLADGTCLDAWLCTGPQEGPAGIHGARSPAGGQACIDKLLDLFQRPDVSVALSWSGVLHQQAPYPAINTARFLALAHRALDMAPERTMAALQGLYEGTAQGPASAQAMPDLAPAVTGTAPPSEPAARDHDHGHGAHPMLEPLDYALTPEAAPAVLGGDALSVYCLLWKAALATAAEGPAWREERLQVAVSCGGAAPTTAYLQAHAHAVVEQGWGELLPDEAARLLPEAQGIPEALRARLGALPAVLDGRGGRRRDAAACAPLLGALAAPGKWRCETVLFAPPLRLDGLLEQMAAHGVGRPSTFAGRLKAARDNHVVDETPDAIVVGSHGELLLAAIEALPPSQRIDARFSSELEQSLREVEGVPARAGAVLSAFSERATGVKPPLAAWLDGLLIDGESLDQAMRRADAALPLADSWEGPSIPAGILPRRLARRHDDAVAQRAALDALLASPERARWRRLRPRERALRRLAALADIDGAQGIAHALARANRDLLWRWWFDLGPGEMPIGADELDAVMAESALQLAPHRPQLGRIHACLLDVL